MTSSKVKSDVYIDPSASAKLGMVIMNFMVDFPSFRDGSEVNGKCFIKDVMGSYQFPTGYFIKAYTRKELFESVITGEVIHLWFGKYLGIEL